MQSLWLVMYKYCMTGPNKPSNNRHDVVGKSSSDPDTRFPKRLDISRSQSYNSVDVMALNCARYLQEDNCSIRKDGFSCLDNNRYARTLSTVNLCRTEYNPNAWSRNPED
ncbi:hypothetical protein CLF_111161 [Clonorchis sinensis]|uniref:Uncharacterized protein n=1 Tax=Clonorchis sinensis TaxID=79923 RepID=G7YUG3_CLOSI|nr:hypothetical protein CLF_111161 [Clonorchis sinensis]